MLCPVLLGVLPAAPVSSWSGEGPSRERLIYHVSHTGLTLLLCLSETKCVWGGGRGGGGGGGGVGCVWCVCWWGVCECGVRVWCACVSACVSVCVERVCVCV